MSEPGYHYHKTVLAAKTWNLLHSLGLSTYNKTEPKIKYWIEYITAEQRMTTEDLAERIPPLARLP